MEILHAKVETTYRHKETGELFKERKDWEAKGFKQEDMAQVLIYLVKQSKLRELWE
jgi:hypothetical protein